MLVCFDNARIYDGDEINSQVASCVLMLTGWSLEEAGFIYVGF